MVPFMDTAQGGMIQKAELPWPFVSHQGVTEVASGEASGIELTSAGSLGSAGVLPAATALAGV